MSGMSEEKDNKVNLEVPEHLEYSDEHVWVDTSVEPAMVGITEYATDQLGELVYIDLPEVGTQVQAGDEVAELESAKAVSTLIAPVAGTIRYVNSEAADDPSIVTSDPYGEGWIFKIELEDDEPDLLSAEEYAKVVE
jgi:glycine cleavage system H protein